MPRHFTAASTEFITFGAGNLANSGTAMSVALIWYANSNSARHGLLRAWDAGDANAVWALNPYSDGGLYWTQGDVVGVQGYTANEWRVDVVTRPAGAGQTVRGHAYRYTNGIWSHANYATSGDHVFTVDHVYLGQYDGDEHLDGDIAVAAVWERALSDGECEQLPGSLDSWRDLGPDALWVLNQTSTAIAVPDSTGGGANQSAISGTSVSSIEVPGFSYGGEQRSLAYRYGMLRDLRLVYG